MAQVCLLKQGGDRYPCEFAEISSVWEKNHNFPVSIVKEEQFNSSCLVFPPRQAVPDDRTGSNALPDVLNTEDSSKAPGVVFGLGLEFIPVMSK